MFRLSFCVAVAAALLLLCKHSVVICPMHREYVLYAITTYIVYTYLRSPFVDTRISLNFGKRSSCSLTPMIDYRN